MAIQLEVWGDLGCFSRPELKVERYSYDVITPSAAIGILEAIFWHPGMHYVIDKIYVLNPICFTSVRRNEVKTKLLASAVKTAIKKEDFSALYIDTKGEIVQRAATVLRDIHYVIEAHFELGEGINETDNEGKFQEMLKRRARKGQCHHQPYFGNREFPAHFKLWDGSQIKTAYPNEKKDLGIMLHHMKYTPRTLRDGSIVYDAAPLFFRAVLDNGVLDLTESEVIR